MHTYSDSETTCTYSVKYLELMFDGVPRYSRLVLLAEEIVAEIIYMVKNDCARLNLSLLFWLPLMIGRLIVDKCQNSQIDNLLYSSCRKHTENILAVCL